MVAEILCVGTELLLGQIVNTDAQFLSQELSKIGVSVYRHTTVGDNPRRLKEAFLTALERSDAVIATGGLGPTMDDLTKETIAEALALKMVLHQESLDKIEAFFNKVGHAMAPNNMKQAMFPKGSIILKNERGTAPGCIIEKDGKFVVILPGPPRELTYMYEHEVRPYLESKSNVRFHSVNLRFFGIGESDLEHRVRDLMESQSNPTIAPYAGSGEVMLRFTASAPDIEQAKQLIAPVEAEIRRRVGQFVYTSQYASMAETVVNVLSEKGLTVALAESCTGGMLSSMLVDIPGSSGVLIGSIVSYSNDVKKSVLSVKGNTLETYGAVSEQTALEMAHGVFQRIEADYSLAVTGIAGPGGDTSEKPVGLVYIALERKRDGYTETRKLQILRERDYVRRISCLNALDMLLKCASGDHK
jgi:nicotinamide-nucleotide amidase